MRLAGAACRGKRGPVEIEFLDSQKASAGSPFHREGSRRKVAAYVHLDDEPGQRAAHRRQSPGCRLPLQIPLLYLAFSTGDICTTDC
jgi:hypothetical protein